MESKGLKAGDMNVPYDSSLAQNNTSDDEPIEEENGETQEIMSPQLYSPQMKLDPQLLENYYINLARNSETSIQELAQRMHAIVNDIVAIFETTRQETLEANLATCRSLIVEIQQMEHEQDLMKYQVEMYTHKVRQAHEQIFSDNTATDK